MSNRVSPDPALRSRILAAATRERSPTRSGVRCHSLAIIAVSVALVLIEFLLVGGMRDAGMPRAPWLIVATMAGILALAATATFLALDRGRSMLGRPAQHLWFTIVFVPLGLFMWKVVWSSLFEGGLDEWPTRVGHKCLTLVITMGLLLFIGYSLALPGERAQPALSGATMGLAAGVTGTVFVELWCPVGHPIHVLYGHIVPILIVSACGAALARITSRT